MAIGFPFTIFWHTCNIVLAHPKYVKAIRGKNRQARCQVDCRHLQARPCFGSFIPQQISASFGIWYAITGNLQTSMLVKRTVLRTALFPTLNWTTYFRMSLEKRLLESNEPFDVKPYLTKNIKKPLSRFKPPWMEKCVPNKLKSSALSFRLNCANSRNP